MSKISPYPSPLSPFHAHEIAVQQAFGVADIAHELGTAMIAPYVQMRRDSLTTMPFMVASFAGPSPNFANETKFLPWSSLFFCATGFYASANGGSTFQISKAYVANAAQDPLIEALKQGTTLPVGLMLIDFERQYRYRINGHVSSFTSSSDGTFSMTIAVREAFGNCPKYIQSRRIMEMYPTFTPNVISNHPTTTNTFSVDQKQMIATCDTFFLSSYYTLPDGETKVDCSHRGGQPGFIRVINDHTLLWPDYTGNNMYMTLGNIHGSRQAGLLLIDFENRGRTLQLSGSATLLLTLSPDLLPLAAKQQLDGATKYVLFELTQPAVLVEQALPFRTELVERSRYNPPLSGASGIISNQDAVAVDVVVTKEVMANKPLLLRLTAVQRWTEEVATFTFHSSQLTAGQQMPMFIPGQYATIQVSMPSLDNFEEMRTWTVTSVTPDFDHNTFTLTMTIKRAGIISSMLHDVFSDEQLQAQTVDELWTALEIEFRFLGFAGDFTIFAQSQVEADSRSLQLTTSIQAAAGRGLFIAGGIGVTPFISILAGLLSQPATSSVPLDIVLLASFRSVEEAAVLQLIAQLAKTNGLVASQQQYRLHVILAITTRSKTSFDVASLINAADLSFTGIALTVQAVSGRITSQLLETEQMTNREVFICGPSSFMDGVTKSLPVLLQERVQTESFNF